jgi:hypothetical protein
MALIENENRLKQAVRQIGRCLSAEPEKAAAGSRKAPTDS